MASGPARLGDVFGVGGERLFEYGSLLATLNYAVSVLRRDWPMVQSLTAETLGLAQDPGLRVFGASARAFRGHALAAQGNAEAIPELVSALEQLREVGASIGRPNHLGMLALAHAAR